jgi:phage shock protein PspC (stress-responsive transcriptional regulator)
MMRGGACRGICTIGEFLVEIADNNAGGNSMAEKNWLQTLSKSNSNKWIGGVCGGFGEHSPVPAWCWRLLFAFLFLFYGTGLVLYVLLWIFMPKEAQGGPQAHD